MRMLDEKYIQKFKATGYLAVQRSQNLSAGQIVDRDEHPILFKNIVNARGDWTLPGTIFEIPGANLEVIETRLVNGVAEVWVDTNGDDSNDGTKDSPLRTIAMAQEIALARGGIEGRKIVNLMRNGKSSTWYEPIFINTPNWHFKGEGFISSTYDTQPLIFIDSNQDLIQDTPQLNYYPLVITNMTRQAYEDWMSRGGPDYIKDSEGLISYSGPSLLGLDTVNFPENFYVHQPGLFKQLNFNCTFENIAIYNNSAVNNNVLGAMCLFVKENGLTDKVQGGEINFKNVNISSNSYYNTKFGRFYLHGASKVRFDGIQSPPTSEDFIGYVFINSNEISIQDNPYSGDSRSKMIVSVDEDHSEAGAYFKQDSLNIFNTEFNNRFNGIDLQTTRINAAESNAIDAALITEQDLFVRGAFPLNGKFGPVSKINCRSAFITSIANHNVVDFVVKNNLSKSGAGLLEIRRLIADEDVILTGGNNVFHSGTIKGNLTVSNGAGIDFGEVRVLGDVDLTQAGEVTWKGGSYYGNLIDPDNKLNGAAPGDYLGGSSQSSVNLEYHKMQVVLGVEDLASIDLDHLIVSKSITVAIGRAMVHVNQDFEITEVEGVSRLTWINSLRAGEVEGVEEGDTVFITYAYIV